MTNEANIFAVKKSDINERGKNETHSKGIMSPPFPFNKFAATWEGHSSNKSVMLVQKANE